MLPKSRKEAILSSSKTFFTGVPCKNGHVAIRRLPGGTCDGCVKAGNERYRRDNPELLHKRLKEREARLRGGAPSKPFLTIWEEEPGEVWRPIVGFEGLYEVSSHGRIKSLGGRKNCLVTRLLRPRIAPKGYRNISLAKNGERHPYPLGRVVCEAFHGPAPTTDHEAAHNDGKPPNNRADNVRWATAKENQADRIIHGTDLRGEDCPAARLREVQVREIKRAIARGVSAPKLADRYGVGASTIKRIRRGQTWAHVV